VWGKMSNGITFSGEKGGPLQFLDYSQHKDIKFYFAYLRAHEMKINSSIPTKVLSVLITFGCKPALGGSTSATIFENLPIISLDIF